VQLAKASIPILAVSAPLQVHLMPIVTGVPVTIFNLTLKFSAAAGKVKLLIVAEL